jgi:hypothetical protein
MAVVRLTTGAMRFKVERKVMLVDKKKKVF